MQLPIDLGYYDSDSRKLAAQNCINLYPNNPDTKGALSTGALFRTPGIAETVLLGTNGPGRGFHKTSISQLVYAVSGNELYFLNTPQTSSLVGAIVGTGRVSMVDNGRILCIIVPGVTGYFFDFSTMVLTEITDPVFVDFNNQFNGINSVTLKDQRFVYTNDTEIILGTNINVNDGQDFNALAFEDVTSSADVIVRARTLRNEIVIFGENTIDFYQTGDPTLIFPYQRVLGATIAKGLRSRFSVVEVDDALAFLGNSEFENPAIWITDSRNARKISTTAIDNTIQNFSNTELSSVTAWTYSQDGHTFAGWHFPSITLVYDLTASAMQQRPVWHQRASNNTTNWRVEDVVSSLGVTLVSDVSTNQIGVLNRENTREYGDPILREFTGMYLFNEANSFRISSVELTTTAGVGVSLALPLNANPAERPQVEMLYSRNGAVSFQSAGNRAIGELDETLNRQIWRRLGRMPTNVVLRFRSTEMVDSEFQRLDVNLKGS